MFRREKAQEDAKGKGGEKRKILATRGTEDTKGEMR